MFEAPHIPPQKPAAEVQYVKTTNSDQALEDFKGQFENAELIAQEITSYNQLMTVLKREKLIITTQSVTLKVGAEYDSDNRMAFGKMISIFIAQLGITKQEVINELSNTIVDGTIVAARNSYNGNIRVVPINFRNRSTYLIIKGWYTKETATYNYHLVDALAQNFINSFDKSLLGGSRTANDSVTHPITASAPAISTEAAEFPGGFEY